MDGEGRELECISSSVYVEGPALARELEERGIEAHLSEYQERWHRGVGGFHLFVPRQRAVEAREIMRAFYSALHEGVGARLRRGEAIHCLECNSTSIEVLKRPPDGALAGFFYRLANGANQARIRCRVCGYARWVGW